MATFDFEYINRRYIFPVQFVVGCIGNILNLIVLNSRGMRTKTNCFLSAMAVADLGFFISMFFLNLLNSYDIGSYSDNHKLFVMYSHIPLVAFANWFSASSIWLSLGVTVERLIAIKFPLLARTYWKKCRIILFIIFVYVAALLFSLYHFAWRTVVRTDPFNDTSGDGSIDRNDSVVILTRTYSWETPSGTDWLRYWYVYISHGFAATTVILLPLVTLIILSSYLVYYLRLNSHAVRGLRAGSALLKRGERRVTSTVVILIAAFTLFNFPSGIYAVIEIGLHKMKSDEKARLHWYYEMAEIVNALVCTNKAINFGLYCSASSGFRRKLIYLTDYRYHNPGHEQLALCRANGGASFLQRRTHSIDANAKSRAVSTVVQLQQFQPQSYTVPSRGRTRSAL